MHADSTVLYDGIDVPELSGLRQRYTAEGPSGLACCSCVIVQGAPWVWGS